MKKEIMEKWVTALRSGEYKQTKAKLKDSTGHCCLGVLCELALKENVVSYEPFNMTFAGSATILPVSVRNWANMKSPNPGICDLGYPIEGTLASLNDKDNSFEKIADIIERYYEEL